MSKEKINHPAHYIRGGLECIVAIEAWDLDYHLGHAVKYIMRAGHKEAEDPVNDLMKASWFVNRRIQLIKSRRLRKRKQIKR